MKTTHDHLSIVVRSKCTQAILGSATGPGGGGVDGTKSDLLNRKVDRLRAEVISFRTPPPY